jgi:hypothetical protein
MKQSGEPAHEFFGVLRIRRDTRWGGNDGKEGTACDLSKKRLVEFISHEAVSRVAGPRIPVDEYRGEANVFEVGAEAVRSPIRSREEDKYLSGSKRRGSPGGTPEALSKGRGGWI